MKPDNAEAKGTGIVYQHSSNLIMLKQKSTCITYYKRNSIAIITSTPTCQKVNKVINQTAKLKFSSSSSNYFGMTYLSCLIF